MVISTSSTNSYTYNGQKRQWFKNLFWFRCHANTFRVPVEAYQRITEIANSKLRASTYKFYRWLCYRANGNLACSFSAQMKAIEKATGLSKPAIIAARKELVQLSLIQASREGGPGGRYYFTVMNPETGLFLDWNHKPWPLYFSAPVASVLVAHIYAKLWTGTDALVYDELCKEMGRSGKSVLPRTKAHWLSYVTKNTLRTAEHRLVATGFIRLKDGSIEMLHPETSNSMPPKTWEQEPSQHMYFLDAETGSRKVFSEELLTPGVIEEYFIKSLPRGAEWVPGYDTYCPFHDDDNPSFTINIETGQWCCHRCGFGGNKLVTFEMQRFGLEDVHGAWERVAKKIGFKACPRSRGKVTHRHEYRDEHGWPCYQFLRYEDDSGSFRRYTSYPLTKAGLGRKTRLLYNLPEVIAADVVLITEGEKKADIFTDLHLLDSDGKPVAVTCTGGADSWKTEFAQHLAGKRALLLPDADKPGQRYSASVQASLQKFGVECSVVDFGDYGNDFRDFLKDHTPDELVKFINSPWLHSGPLNSLCEVGEDIRI